MESTDTDRDLQEKVRRRLIEIKKQLIQNENPLNDCGFMLNDVQKLWRK